MKLNRRNTLIGLGTIVAGGGAALGTGAFSSVEADRNVNISTEGDANALLGFDIDNETLSGDDGEIIEFSFEDDLNLNAVTRFESFVITNNGSEEIEVSVESENGSGTVGFTDDAEGEEDAGMYFEEGSFTSPLTLEGGGDETFDVVFNLQGENTSSDGNNAIPDGITFIAEQTED